MSHNYQERFEEILSHAPGKHFLLDCGGDQASMSIFVYKEFLKYLGVERLPQINSLVQLSAMPDKEFLEKYDIGFRWLYPKGSARVRKRAACIADYTAEYYLEKGYVSGGSDVAFYDDWGVKWSRSAYYYEQVEHPLQGKSYDDVVAYDFPDPNDPLKTENLDQELAAFRKENKDYVVALSQSYGGLLETALWIRGYTDFYVDLASDSKECAFLLDAILEHFIAFNRNYLSAVEGDVQILAIGDDYGMQDRLLISPEAWRKHIKPRLQQLISSVKDQYSHIKIFLHSCGAVSELIDDFIEVGVDILNPIQPKASGMDPVVLKKKYGDRIVFHGGIDVQELLPCGSPQQVKDEVWRRLDILAENGGYIIAPSHNIQAGTPVENVIAFYNAVLEYSEKIR